MPEWWIELAVSITWPVVALLALVAFVVPIWKLLGLLAVHLQDAEKFEATLGGASIKTLRRELPAVSPDNPELIGDENLVANPVPDGTKEAYNEIGKGQRGLHLVHALAPSELPGQKYQVFLFLVGHQRSRFGFPDDLSDVVAAEFYLGRMWQDQVFSVEPDRQKLLGLSTHAYGPFLCVCRVTFKHNRTAELYRYVDFPIETAQALTTGRRGRRGHGGRSHTEA